MAETTIKGFEFPVADETGMIESSTNQFYKYDYTALANIPEHEKSVSLETIGNTQEYKIDNNVHVTKKLRASGDVQIDGRTTFGNMFVLSDTSFGDTLPTTSERVFGRIFFVKLQE